MYNRHLETFIQVVESGSFAKASEKLFISTVAVMKQINALEDTVGVKLLERTSQGVVLTAAGRSIYESAQEIIRMSSAAVQRAREIDRTERYTIRIGSSRLHPYHTILSELYAMDGSLPFQLNIVPYSDESTDLPSALQSLGKDFDCFITPCDTERWKNKYSMYLFQSQPYRIAVPRTHRLAGKNLLTLEDLHGDKLLFLVRGFFSNLDALRDRIETEHPEIQLVDFSKSYNIGVFNECVQQNCPMISLDMWSDVHPFMVTLPVDWDCEAQFGLVYSKTPSRELQEFISILGGQSN